MELQARSHEWALTLCLTKGMEDLGLKILIGPKGRCKVWADHGNSRGIRVRAREHWQYSLLQPCPPLKQLGGQQLLLSLKCP